MNTSLSARSRPSLRASCWRLLIMGVLAAASLAPARAQGGPAIRLRYATFDPLQGTPQVPDELRMPPLGNNDAGLFLLQFQGPVRRQWVDAVKATGVVFEDYVPDYAFLVRTTLRHAASLPGRFRFVRWTGAFHPAYKIDSRLLEEQGQVPVLAQAFTQAEGQGLALRLRQNGATVLGLSRRTLHVAGSARMAVQLARTPEVKWVQTRTPFRLWNDRGSGIMGAAGSQGARSHGLFGKGQIVCVADTGLDTGSMNTLNDDFKGRVRKGYALGRPTTDDWSDQNSHGTHVAGSVLGAGLNSGSDPSRHDYDTSFAGNAPEAELVFQSVEDDSGALSGIPFDLNDLFQAPYDDGARIHTNSWGADTAGEYTIYESSADEFLHDHPEMTVLYAAGNAGADSDDDGIVDLDSMGSPANAKNVITVGATENRRPPGEGFGGYTQYAWDVFGFAAAPLATDYISDNPEGMAAFSSRGPCDDGRIKPDVCAPGTDVVSVWSAPAAAAGQNGWGRYDANYIYMGGTSMACPLTAGAATLVREFYGSNNVSAALVKATLINGAHDMNPGQYGTGNGREMGPRPNNVEGFGRVDVARSLFPAKPRQVHPLDRPAGLETGLYHRLRFVVKDSSEPLCVTLVWTDPPATPSAAVTLVNNLDLLVTDPGGRIYYPNRGLGPDVLNNVENLDVAQPPTGIWEIRIEGANVPQGPQTYALVVSGGGAPVGGSFPDIVPPQVAIVSPASGAEVRGVLRVEASATDNRAVDKVALWLDDKTYLGSRFRAPYVFYINTNGAKKGSHVLRAIAHDFGKNTAKHLIPVTIR